MTKPELEEHCERLVKERDFYSSILYVIKKELVCVDEVFRNGLAEESDFNLGVQHALDVVASIINARVRETSYLHCPSFRNTQKEAQIPRFTVIEGGLANANKGDV